MKPLYIIAVVLAFSAISCKKEVEIKKVHHDEMATSTEKLNVKVVNELDPICEMPTHEFLTDTANYKGKTYGFCSAHCKEEFKKTPEKFAVK